MEHQIDFEKIEKMWATQNERLSKVNILQENTVQMLIHSSRATQCGRLGRNKVFMLTLCGIALFYLISNMAKFVYDIKYLIPFVVLSTLLATSIVGYMKTLSIIKVVSDPSSQTSVVYDSVKKLRRREKKEMVISFIVALPLLLFCLPPITSRLFNRLDFYSNFMAYLPAMVIGAILSLIVGVLYYYHNMRRIDIIEKYED